jgi:hypothetical protein
MWRIGRAPNSIPTYEYIQQDATLHRLFISGNCSTCFGWYFHPSSGEHTTVSTASGICHTVTAICRYRGRVGTGLSVLWVVRERDHLEDRGVAGRIILRWIFRKCDLGAKDGDRWRALVNAVMNLRVP